MRFVSFSHAHQFPDHLHNECTVFTFGNDTFQIVWRRVAFNRLQLFSTVYFYIAFHDEQSLNFRMSETRA